jgi:TPR repeat protein
MSEALKWFEKAADKGYENAKKKLAELDKTAHRHHH